MHFLPHGFRFPEPLALALSEHFWRADSPAPTELRRVGKALAALWPRLAHGRGQEDTRHYAFSAEEVNAYAAYYLPANCLKTTLVLAEAESLGIDMLAGNELDWVDVGSGPGTALTGLAWWSQHRQPPRKLVNIDQSPLFLSAAAELRASLARVFPATPPLATRKVGRKPGAALAAILAEDPGVVSFVNSIAEIFPDMEERARALRELGRELGKRAERDGKPRWLLLIEPGSREAGRELLALREEFRSGKLGNERILLPCLDARACGALAQSADWCHEEVACVFPDWLNELGSQAGIRKEAMLFSYLLTGFGPVKTTALWPAYGARMVSQRLERKGLTECWFCTVSGKQKLRISDRAQKQRETPLASPARGDIYRGMNVGNKGEILALEKFSPANADYEALFPRSMY